MGNEFSGFSSQTLQYLSDLKANNDKLWFEAHRAEYQAHLLTPMQQLVAAMGDFMLTIDPQFAVKPAINRTISRMNRDVRFAKDKSPYRSNMWITFKQPRKNWQDAPAFYFELFPDWYRYGMGFYNASRQTMDNFRAAIDEEPEAFLRAVAFHSQEPPHFELIGDVYKRPLSGNHPAQIQTWYQRKSFFLVHNAAADDKLFSRQLVIDLQWGFSLLAPLYQFISKSKNGED